MTAPENVYQVEIATTSERLWQAIVDPEQTRKYYYGALSKSDWTVGSRWTSEGEDGEVYLDGEILEIDPPRRLVHTLHVVHEPTAAAEAPSRVEYEITQIRRQVPADVDPHRPGTGDDRVHQRWLGNDPGRAEGAARGGPGRGGRHVGGNLQPSRTA
jgi:uncharacterized protein YndB with AHSA1/START domain